VVTAGQQGRFGDGLGDQAAITDVARGAFVGPAFGGVAHCGGHRPQQRIGRRRQIGQGDKQVMPAGQVGAFVGEQYLALPSVQGVEHSGGHHDPTRYARQGVGVRARVVEHH
jgi:hypothetical protein